MNRLLQHFRTLAHANRLANYRLHSACSTLTHEEFKAPRTSFFPSLWATLNHILIVEEQDRGPVRTYSITNGVQ